jgi:hypothetical protein
MSMELGAATLCNNTDPLVFLSYSIRVSRDIIYPSFNEGATFTSLLFED